MARPPRSPDLEAELTFLSTEKGGKSKPARSGYRPSHDFGIVGMLNDGHHEFVGSDSVNPGESIHSLVWLASPELQKGRLHAGFEFIVQEGARVVARGVITDVLNADLQKPV